MARMISPWLILADVTPIAFAIDRIFCIFMGHTPCNRTSPDRSGSAQNRAARPGGPCGLLQRIGKRGAPLLASRFDLRLERVLPGLGKVHVGAEVPLHHHE